MSEHTFLFQGAGEANIGIADLIARAMEKREGISLEEARKKIWMKDSRGLLVKDRPEGGITHHKAPYAHEHAPMKDLGEMVNELKPTVLIGAAAIPNNTLYYPLGIFMPHLIYWWSVLDASCGGILCPTVP